MGNETLKHLVDLARRGYTITFGKDRWNGRGNVESFVVTLRKDYNYQSQIVFVDDIAKKPEMVDMQIARGLLVADIEHRHTFGEDSNGEA